MTIFLAVCTVSAVSWIITREQIFEPVRKLVKGKPGGYVMQCPFCLSVWVTLAVFLMVSLEWRYFFLCVWGSFHSLAVFRRLKG